jgi:PIN domain nuclease of toxin-antitoxin system
MERDVEALYLDTHVVVWLFAAEVERLTERGRDLIESRELLVSPMVLLELEYLHEIGRLRYGQETVFASLHESIDLALCDCAFARVAKLASQNSWTRDPFDRMIVAQAMCGGGVLLTRDQRILEHWKGAVW